jgi:hypothetical protein
MEVIKHVKHALTVTPIEADGRQLTSTKYLLSQDDVERSDFGELLRPLILDWAEIARWIDNVAELVEADSSGSLGA